MVCLQTDWVLGVLDGCARIKQFKDSLARGSGLVQLVMKLGQGFDRLIHDDDGQNERHEIASSGFRTIGEKRDVKQYQGHAKRAEKFGELAWDFVRADYPHDVADVFLRRLLELSQHRLLE